MNEKYSHWRPFAFCAVLSLITIVGGLLIAFMSSTTHPFGAGLAFYGFMPMCFYMVSLATSRLQRENQDLRNQIQELRQDFTQQKEVA